MSYSAYVVICLILHFIVSFDVFFSNKKSEGIPAIKSYRFFLLAIGVFYVSDILWGVLYENKWALAVYIETFFYFILMALTILLWARYVVKFLEGNRLFGQIMTLFGLLYFFAQVVLLILNIPFEILFRVDLEKCIYKNLLGRDILYYVQIGIYVLLSIYTLVSAFKSGYKFKRRYLAIFLFSIINAAVITIQLWFPTIPLYTTGLFIGVILLNTFVVTDIKEEYRQAIVEHKKVEKKQQEELSDAIHLAYTDPLTNIKNKHAYVETEYNMDQMIANKEIEEFAIVMFDLNGLKSVNDTKGHKDGDKYIVDAVQIIKKYFGEEELYRFGGDEFVSILMGDKYHAREKILKDFNSFIDDCMDTDKPIISAGMSTFNKNTDNTFRAVFVRADKMMYDRKEKLKKHLFDN